MFIQNKNTELCSDLFIIILNLVFLHVFFIKCFFVPKYYYLCYKRF